MVIMNYSDVQRSHRCLCPVCEGEGFIAPDRPVDLAVLAALRK